LEENRNYRFLFDHNNPNITPYTWTTRIVNETLTNNTKGLDLSGFEALRMGLANTYNSQTITHAGYFLGFLAIFVTLVTKIEEIRKHCYRFVEPIIFGFITGLFLFSGYRMLFWSWMGSEVLTVTETQAISQGQNTLISGIQRYLLEYFKTNPLLGPIYQVDKWFTLSLLLVSIGFGILILLLIFYLTSSNFKNYRWVILLRCYYERCRYRKKSYRWVILLRGHYERWCRKKMKELKK
jgi:hypothetical protein